MKMTCAIKIGIFCTKSTMVHDMNKPTAERTCRRRCLFPDSRDRTIRFGGGRIFERTGCGSTAPASDKVLRDRGRSRFAPSNRGTGHNIMPFSTV